MTVPKLVSTKTIFGFSHNHHPLEELMSDKIHYGCGNYILSEWLNVDGFDGSFAYENIDLENRVLIFPLDVSGPHPFPSNYFAFGYSEHMIEHLSQADSIIFLSESFRTLKQGGVLRLCFPGLKGVLNRHYRSSDFQGAERGKFEAFTHWSHVHYYCFESLSLIARHIGFSEVKEVEHGASCHSVFRNLESRPPKEDSFELIVELTK